MKFRSTALLLAFATCGLSSHADVPDEPFARSATTRPAAVEASWTPLRMPDGSHTALLGMSYYVAVNDDWGLGPSAYAAAAGRFGGLVTFGASAQRRWRLNSHTHVAAALYVGAGGGVSSDQVRFGGGLIMRPELSLRSEFGDWYSGASLAYVRFPSGNVHGASLGFVLGHTTNFTSFDPADEGLPGRTSERTGLKLDEVTVMAGIYSPRASSRDRAGNPVSGHMDTAGAELRQYFYPGSWWGLEAAGAAHGGADGYMEGMAVAGQDFGIGSPKLRLGLELGLGLGGGGNVNTGNGWLLRAGPTLRWITPWGATLMVDAGLLDAHWGTFSARYLRAGLSLPLDFGSQPGDVGTVRNQQLGLSLMHYGNMPFKDGHKASISTLSILMTHDLTPTFYGVAQAGSAAFGQAGAYSIGLVGLGAHTAELAGGLRLGAEALGGAAGGGGVDVSGGAVAQFEAYAQWQWQRLRLRTGAGEWRTLRGSHESAPMAELSASYAFGILER